MLSHVYIVDHLWLTAMSGDSTDTVIAAIPRFVDEVKGRPLSVFADRFAQVAERFGTFLAGLDDPGAQRPLWEDGRFL